MLIFLHEHVCTVVAETAFTPSSVSAYVTAWFSEDGGSIRNPWAFLSTAFWSHMKLPFHHAHEYFIPFLCARSNVWTYMPPRCRNDSDTEEPKTSHLWTHRRTFAFIYMFCSRDLWCWKLVSMFGCLGLKRAITHLTTNQTEYDFYKTSIKMVYCSNKHLNNHLMLQQEALLADMVQSGGQINYLYPIYFPLYCLDLLLQLSELMKGHSSC